MKLSREQIELFETIHKEVYKMFSWTSDDDNWSMPEKWTRPVIETDWFNREILKGDCEDMALEVYFRLRQQHNFPKDALRLCVLKVPVDDDHADTPYNHCVLALEYQGEDDEVYHIFSDCNFKHTMLLSDLKRRGYTNFFMSQVGKPITDKWEKVYE